MVTITSNPTRGSDQVQPLNPDEEAAIRVLNRIMYALPRAIDADLVREQRLPSLTTWP
ncbi:hypothetical protein [Micromonospora sp. NPDC005161]